MEVWMWMWVWLVVDLPTCARLTYTHAQESEVPAIRRVGSPLRVSGHGLDVQDLRCVSLNLEQLVCRWTVPCPNCTVSSRILSWTTAGGRYNRGYCQCHGIPDRSQQPCDCSRTCCWWGVGPYDYLERDVTIEITIFSGNGRIGLYKHIFNTFEIVLPDKLETVFAVVEDRTRLVNVSWVMPTRMTVLKPGVWVRVDYRLATDITTELSWVCGEVMLCNSCREGHAIVEVDVWWQRYQLRVRLRSGASAFTLQEDGWWSQFDPVYVTTPPSAPTSAPTLGPGSFLSEDGAPGRRDLTLNWHPIPPSLHNGSDFTYAAIATLIHGEREEVILPNNVTNTFATFRNLSCDIAYRLEVAAVNSVGRSATTSEMVVGPSSSLPTPPALPVVVLHRRHVYELRWRHEGGVEAVNYTVYLCTDHLFSPRPCEDSLYWKSVGNVTSVNLTLVDFGVRKQMTLQVRLAVSAVSNDGGWSGLAWDQCTNPRPYTTARTLPTLSNPVLLNNSAVEVPWSLECEDRAGVVEAVEAVYCLGHLNLPEECTGDALMVNGDVWSDVVVIGGLGSGSRYTVWVRLQYRSGPSLWAAPATITTPAPDLTSWTVGLITTAAIIVSVIVILGLLHCRRELVTFSQKTAAKIKLPSGILDEDRVCLHNSEESDPSRTDPSSCNGMLIHHTPIPTVNQAIPFLDPTNTTSEPSLYARKPTPIPTIPVPTPNTANPIPNLTIPTSNSSIPIPNPAIATHNSANPALDTTVHSPNFITPVPSSADPFPGYVDPFSSSFELTSDPKNVVNCDQNLPVLSPTSVDVTSSPTDSNFNPTDSNSNPTDSNSNPTDSNSNPTDSNSNPTDPNSDSNYSPTNIMSIPAKLNEFSPSSPDTIDKPTDTTPSSTGIRDSIPDATDNIPNFTDNIPHFTDIKDTTSNPTDSIDMTPNPMNNKDVTPNLTNINNITHNSTDSISNYIDPTEFTPSPTDLTDTTPNPTDTAPNPTDTTSNPTDTTSYPTDTTSNPTDTTSNPTDTTSNPTDTTSNPTDTTSNPTDTASNPTDTAANPTDTAANPTGTTTNPTDTAANLTDTAANPTDTTPNPTDTAANPTDTTSNPTDTILNLTDTTPNLTDNTPNPTDTTPNPRDTTPNPTDITRSPSDTTPNPTDTTPNPTDTTSNPTDTTPNLTDTTPNPTDTTPNPTDTTPNPTDTTPNPTDTTPNPTDTTPNSTDITRSPSDTTPNPTDTTPNPTDTTPNLTDTTPNPTDSTDTTPNPADPKYTSSNPTNASPSTTHPTESTPNPTYSISNPNLFIMGATDLKNCRSESSATKRWTGEEVVPVSVGCGLTQGGWVLQRELDQFPYGQNSLAAQDSASSTHNPPLPMPVLLTPSVVPLSSLFTPLRSSVVPHVSSHEKRLSKTGNQADGVYSSMKMNTESPQMNPKQSEVNHKHKSDLGVATQMEMDDRKVSKSETLAIQNDRPCEGYVAVKAADHKAKETSFAQSDTVTGISRSLVKIENYRSPDISAMGESCTSAVEPALFLSQSGCVEDTKTGMRHQSPDYIQLSVMSVKVDVKESMTETKQSVHQNEISKKLNITPLSPGYVAIQYSGEVASAVTATE